MALRGRLDAFGHRTRRAQAQRRGAHQKKPRSYSRYKNSVAMLSGVSRPTATAFRTMKSSVAMKRSTPKG